MADTGPDKPHTLSGSRAQRHRREEATEQVLPDFDHEALAHLQIQADEIFLHVQLFVDRDSERNRRQLVDYMKRFRNTLVLLEKIAATYVVEELLTLMQVDASGKIANRSELARVLATAADQFCEYVATLQQDTSVDSALPLLPLVNDSRACREESLLSDTIVLAAGIELPRAKQADLTDGEWVVQRNRWVDFAASNHSAYARGLLGWWRSGEVEAIRSLAVVLRKFAKLCSQYDYLHVIAPLFQSASIVAVALEERELDDGPALRSMFAQLERNIHRSTLVETPDDLLPGDLLRNYLYYVAQTESSSRSALDLRRQFRLDRIREAALVNQSSMTPTIGVGYHLATAIRAGIANETVSLHSWLLQPAATLTKPKVIRLLVRLSQLEPVLTLMGESAALACLQQINAQLQQLQTESQVSQGLKQSLGQSLQQLDELLDQSARRSITRGAGALESASVDGADVFVDMATDTLIREARSSLRIAANDLACIFVNPENEEVSYAGIVMHLTQINNALQILPLPEINALVRGLCDLLERCESGRWLGRDLTAAALINNEDHSLPLAASANEDKFEADSVEQEIARLLVSIDFYLGCVLQPQPAASQLLLQANDALDCARARFDGALESAIRAEPESELFMADILESMHRLGESLQTSRRNPESASIIAIHLALADYRQTTGRDPDSQNARLAAAAEAWFARVASTVQHLSDDHLCLLEEVHALIPQLADKSSVESRPVPAFDELLEQLHSDGSLARGMRRRGSSADASNRDTFIEPTEATLSEDDIEMVTVDSTSDSWLVDDQPESDFNSFTLNVDDELLKAPRQPPTEASLDNTLQYVFYSESLGHLESLENSVRKALQPSADNSNRLPNEQMLRALHTLTSSAQTVDAQDILAIVQPLQKASLVRQRLELSFDAPQTRYIGDLAMALRARLDSLNSGKEVGQSVKAVEQKLPGFIDSIAPSNADDVQNGQSAQPVGLDSKNSSDVSLSDVFAEEAREILDKLRDLVYAEEFDRSAVDRALGLLHTLKGSARMVGKTGISQIAHELESQVQQTPAVADQRVAIKSGFQTIQAQLQQAVDRKLLATSETQDTEAPVLAEKKTEGLLVSDTAYNALLDLATDLTVNHARLSEELAVLRESYQDIGTTARRWRNLSRLDDITRSTDHNEMRADLETAIAVMRSSLRQAEREQQNASRVSASLLQTLIRTRLVRVDEAQERLSKVIQDACDTRGVSANLVFEGGEITLDRLMFKQLLAPLEHIARNAVVHGIEPAEHRLALGKPAAGILTLNASVDGTDLVIRFSDDGRGIDRPALNKLAISRGQNAILTHEDLQQAVFSSGFSSVKQADSLAGHGLGLAAVKVVAEQLGGQAQLRTDTSSGTEIILRLPQRMVVNQVVLVSSGGLLYAVPVGFVDSVLVDGIAPENSERYESLRLDVLLSHIPSHSSLPTTNSSNHAKATVLVTVRNKSLALQIDRIVGYRELVTQALGPQMSSLDRFIGGSVLPDGRQVLILDLVKLAKSIDPQPAMAVMPARESLRPVALIVDDSLTMRVASEKVLRQCGIAVRLAKDGMEAFESIAHAMPNLIIVDLEMPRLDGMSLLERLKERYGSACPPLIIISSRDDIQNRRRSEALGVVRFLAKPFTESALLESIEAAGLRIPDLTIA